VKRFLFPSDFLVQIVTHMWGAKEFFCSTLVFEFFFKFWAFYRPIQSSFSFSFQKYQNFWKRTKINVFAVFFFSWNYFLWGRIPSFLKNNSRNVKRLWEDFRGHLLLWGTIWEEFCSQCDSHCEKIVRRMRVEMNNLIDNHEVLKHQLTELFKPIS